MFLNNKYFFSYCNKLMHIVYMKLMNFNVVLLITNNVGRWNIYKKQFKKMRRIIVQDYKNSKSKQQQGIENYVTNHINEYGLCKLKKQEQQTLLDDKKRKISFLQGNKNRILRKTNSCTNFINVRQELSNKKINKQFVLPLSPRQMKEQGLCKLKNSQKIQDEMSFYSTLNILNFPIDKKYDSILCPSTSQYRTDRSNQLKKNKYKQLQFKIKTPRVEKRTTQINEHKKQQLTKGHHKQNFFINEDDYLNKNKINIKNQNSLCKQCIKKSKQITVLKQMLSKVSQELKFMQGQHKNIQKQIMTLKDQFIHDFDSLTRQLRVKQAERSAEDDTCSKIQQKKQNKNITDESQSSVIKIKIDEFIEQISVDISKIIDNKFIIQNDLCNGRQIGKIVKINNMSMLDRQIYSADNYNHIKETMSLNQMNDWPQEDYQSRQQRIMSNQDDQD